MDTVYSSEEKENKDTPNKVGANGKTSDPREQVMWDFYVKGMAKGITNAYKAAIDAGYSEDSAHNITCREWFKERASRLRRKDILSKGEKVLDKTLSYEPVNEEGKLDIGLINAQLKAAIHVTSTLGKDDGYSSRSELTGKGGSKLIEISPETQEIVDNAIDMYLNGKQI